MRRENFNQYPSERKRTAMDFGNAAMLIAALFGLVQLVKVLVWGQSKERIVVGIVIIGSLVVVFLIGASVWAHEQVLGGHPLDEIGVWSKIVVALFLAGVAATAYHVFDTVGNIGQNKLSETQQRALDLMATRQAGGLFEAQHPGTTSIPPKQ